MIEFPTERGQSMRAMAVVLAVVLAGCASEADDPEGAEAPALAPTPEEAAPAPVAPQLGMYSFSAFMGCELAQGEYQLAAIRGDRDEYAMAGIEAAKKDRERADEYRKAAAGLAEFPEALEALKAVRAAERLCYQRESANAAQDLKRALARLDAEMELISVPSAQAAE